MKKKYIFEILLLIGLIAVDLISKKLVFYLLQDSQTYSYTIIDKIFAFRLARNTGASFSILSGQTTLLTILPIIASIGLIALLAFKRNLPTIARLGIILIVGGAIGNVVDRIVFRYVRDFIDYVFFDTFFGIDFAIGNIADLFLCVGVVLLVVYIIFVFEDKDLYSKKKLEELAKQNNEALKDGE